MGSLEKISVLTSRSLLKVHLLHCSRLCDYLMLDCINIRKFKHESECVCIFLSLICLQIHAAKLLLLQEVNNLYSESSRTTPKTFKELSETFLLLHIRCLSVWRQVKWALLECQQWFNWASQCYFLLMILRKRMELSCCWWRPSAVQPLAEVFFFLYTTVALICFCYITLPYVICYVPLLLP